MDLNQLHYFVTVAETENVSKAAQKLFVTQSALSRAISRMETELGLKLFDRKPNTLLLNENGQLFLKYARQGLDTINSGVHALRQRTSNRQLLVSNYVFLDKFASFCDRCLTEFSDVDLTTFDGSRSVSDFPTGTVPDLVIIPEKNFRDYNVVKAYTESWCVMYHKNYNFRSNCNGTGITAEQLQQERILFDNSPYDREILKKLFQQLPEEMHFATQPDESRVAINRCQAIGIVPVAAYLSLRQRVPDTPVQAMLINGKLLNRMIYLSCHPNFRSCQEDYAILELLDRHIESELKETSDFIREYFHI